MLQIPFTEDVASLIGAHKHFNSDPDMQGRFKIFTLDKCFICGKVIVRPDCFKVVGVEFVWLRELGLTPHKWIDNTSIFMGAQTLIGLQCEYCI